MATDITRELITYLTEIYAIEQQGLALLAQAVNLAGDEQIAEIYRTHCLQSEEHARSIAERLQAHGRDSSPMNDTTAELEFLGVRIAPDGEGSPARLAIITYALESLEIAAYRFTPRGRGARGRSRHDGGRRPDPRGGGGSSRNHGEHLRSCTRGIAGRAAAQPRESSASGSDRPTTPVARMTQRCAR